MAGACTLCGAGAGHVLPVLHARHFGEGCRPPPQALLFMCPSRPASLCSTSTSTPHHAWQTATEGNEAKRLIDALLCLFFMSCPSSG